MKWHFINFLFSLQMVFSENTSACKNLLAQWGQALQDVLQGSLFLLDSVPTCSVDPQGLNSCFPKRDPFSCPHFVSTYVPTWPKTKAFHLPEMFFFFFFLSLMLFLLQIKQRKRMQCESLNRLPQLSALYGTCPSIKTCQGPRSSC